MCGRYVVAVLALVLPLASGLLTNCQHEEGGGCSVFCQCSGDMHCEAGHQICRGPGKVDDPCHATRPCGPGLTCEAGTQICRGPGGVDDPCHATRPCRSGLTCEAGTHICRGPGGVDDPCHATRPCGSGLTCEAGTHICRGPGKEDDPCHLTRPCASGFICKEQKQICERMGGVGEKCVPQSHSAYGRACNYEKHYWCGPVSGRCLAPSRKGKPCGIFGDKYDLGTCASGLTCKCDTVCVIQDILSSVRGAISRLSQTIQDWNGSTSFCCKCH